MGVGSAPTRLTRRVFGLLLVQQLRSLIPLLSRERDRPVLSSVEGWGFQSRAPRIFVYKSLLRSSLPERTFSNEVGR
jgi:hypothetical protein